MKCRPCWEIKVSILHTLILKITNIWFSTNDLTWVCSKIALKVLTQVNQGIKLEDEYILDLLESSLKMDNQDTRLCLDRVYFIFSLVFDLVHCT